VCLVWKIWLVGFGFIRLGAHTEGNKLCGGQSGFTWETSDSELQTYRAVPSPFLELITYDSNHDQRLFSLIDSKIAWISESLT
jgi:hypothetical protein